MRNLATRLNNAPYRLAAMVTVGTTALSAAANAQGGIGGMATTVDGQFSALGKALLGGAFLGGVGLAGAGLIKLKAAADSAGREPYGPGVWRLAVGGGLVALPFMTGAFRDTFTGGSTTPLAGGTATFQ